MVSILLAAPHKTAPPEAANRRALTAPVWLGVLGAVMVAGSFAAVLSFSTSVLSSRAQDAAGGLLSVLAGGYFYTLPGVADASDWYASALLS